MPIDDSHQDTKGQPEPAEACSGPAGSRCRQTLAFQTLIIDDEDLVREVMKAQLAAIGVDAIAVETRAEAIQQLRQTTFDLIFMDTRLADLTEEDVLAEIPGVGERTTLAIISGLDRSVPPGATFLLKPVTLAEIRNVVTAAQARVEASLCNCAV